MVEDSKSDKVIFDRKMVEERDYWLKQLSQERPAANLLLDYQRPESYSPATDRIEVCLDEDINRGLLALTGQSQSLLYAALMAALKICLYKYTGQSTIVVGSPAHRGDDDSQQPLNALAIVDEVDEALPVRQFLLNVRQTLLDAYARQKYPFGYLLKDLNLDRVSNKCPLFDIALALSDIHAALPDVKNDITLTFSASAGRIQGIAEFNKSIFSKESIERFVQHFINALNAILEDNRRSIAQVQVVTAAERQQLATEWNETIAEFPSDLCLHQLFEHQAAQTPDALALVYEEQQVSYAELNRRANQLAHHLQAHGVGAESRVALLLERSVEMVVGVLGVLKAGGAYVPLDPAYPAERLSYMQVDAGVRFVLAQQQLVERVPTALQAVCLDNDWEVISQRSDENPVNYAQPENLMYVIYTSGSTGVPKAAAIEHRQFVNYLKAVEERIRPAAQSGFATVSTLAADLGNTVIFLSLCSGGCLHVISQERAFDPRALADYFEQHPVDYLKIVPSHLQAIQEPASSTHILPRRCLILGGEASRADWVASLQTQAPGCTILNHYGPTETTVGVLTHQVQSESLSLNTSTATLPLGRPLANTQVYLLDRHLTLVPQGAQGELFAGGLNVSRGYLGNPDSTAQRFLPDPFSAKPGARMYRTGDLARRGASGDVEFLGRADYQVKVRGFRVELGEIEAALKQHPDIEEAAVVTRPDASGANRLAAYVVADPKRAPRIKGRRRYKLPNNMAVAHLNKNETDYLYKEIYERRVYLRHGITLRDGDCVFDVGANLGLFSLLVNQVSKAASVYAFEPNPAVFDLLQINASLYAANVKAFNYGLSHQTATADFTAFPQFSLLSGFYADAQSEKEMVKAFVGNIEKQGEDGAGEFLKGADEILDERLKTQSFKAELRTLSEVMAELNVPHINLLKINVEKSELNVLDGIEAQDWEKIDQLVLEVDVQENLEPIVALLERQGYDVVVEQDELMAHTQLHYVYAIRPSSEKRLIREQTNLEQAAPLPLLSEPLLSTGELQRFVEARLPHYMIPASFVMLEAMPLTANGKIDRRALPEMDKLYADSDETYVAPRSDMELALAAVWKDVLRVERVGVRDNFFELGGHSLLMGQVQSKIKKSLDRDISIVDLFKYPSIAALSEYFSQQQLDAPSSAALRGGRYTSRKAALRDRNGKPETAKHPADNSQAESNGFKKPADENDIAIVGMAGRFPGAGNLQQFWQNLREGIESISVFTAEELESSNVEPSLLSDANYVPSRAILENVDLFDASFFGFKPREAAIMDPQQRVFLECAWEALENAGYDSERFAGVIGIYAGISLNTYGLFNLYSNRDVIASMGDFQSLIASDRDFLTTQVSYKLNLTGPSVTVQTACSTSLVAVHMACRSLMHGEADMILAGGVSAIFPQKSGYLYQEGSILSPDGHCRAFDASAGGTVGGSGVGLVVLKRLKDALADGDHIHAVIKGSAVNNDGAAKVGYTAPSVDGQAAVINEALAVARVEPQTITYVEAHGTGTTLGDPIEVAALTQAFRSATNHKGFCAVGSVKSNIGHADVAAGIAGLLKTVLAMRHEQLPPSLHFERSNPQIDFDSSPFFVNDELRAWLTPPGLPRRAGVSSFGIGGTNAHLILEQAPAPPAPAPSSRHAQLLVCSARSATALTQTMRNLRSHLSEHPQLSLADAAYTLQVGRRHFNHRRAVVCSTVEEAVKLLDDAANSETTVSVATHRAVAMLFPGQGAQYVQMGRALYESEAMYRDVIDHCAEVLREPLGCDLRDALYPGMREGRTPDEAEQARASRLLGRTWLTQPALFAVEYGLAALLMNWGVRVEALLGHSLGEYVAGCLAGVFTLEDALRLVAARGRLMQQAGPGAMLAVLGERSEQVGRWAAEAQLDVAAINSPEVVVLSGSRVQVRALEEQLERDGVQTRRLQTRRAFHSRMMEEASRQYEAVVRGVKLRAPRIAMVSNVTGEWLSEEQACDPAYWARQMRETVRFGAGVEKVLEGAEKVLVEVGPGRALSGLVRQHTRAEREVQVIATLGERASEDASKQRAEAQEFVSRLWQSGVEIDWEKMWEGEKRRRVELPTYPFERQRYWIEAAHGNGVGQHEAAARKVVTEENGQSASLKDERAADAESGVALKRSEIASWFYAPSWKRVALPEGALAKESAERRASWLVFASEHELSAGVVEKFRAAGQDIIRVTRGETFASVADDDYLINPGRAEDYDALFKALDALGRLPLRILHLWNLTAREDASGVEAFGKSQASGFYSLLFLAQAVGRHMDEPLELLVVTSDMQDVSGQEELSVEKATVLGPCKVIMQEYPHVQCRSIDVAVANNALNQERTLNQLYAELAATCDDLVVSYRGDDRWVQSYEPLSVKATSNGDSLLRAEGVYLITGWGEEIAPVLAKYLAQKVRARLVLAGPVTLPERSEWETFLKRPEAPAEACQNIRDLLALEELGAELLLCPVDIADERQMQEVIEKAYERFGTLHGVIHAAGIGGQKTHQAIQELTVDDCELCFKYKAHALFVLEKVLRGRALDFCLLQSSLSAVLGGLGLAAYTAANIFMDAFAHRQQRFNGVSWITVNWDAWRLSEEGEQKAGAAGTLADLAMGPQEGLEVFARVLSVAATPHLVVSTANLRDRISQWTKPQTARRAASSSAASIPLHPRPQLANALVLPSNQAEQQVADVWQEILGIDRIGINDNFFELGGGSLLATQLVSRLRKAFAVELPLRTLFERPTIAELAAFIKQTQVDEAKPTTAAEIVPLSRESRRVKVSRQGEIIVAAEVATEDKATHSKIAVGGNGRTAATSTSTPKLPPPTNVAQPQRETKLVDFSLFFFSAEVSGELDGKYRLLLESTKFADQHGFAAVWTPERHFHAFGGLYPNPSVISASLAMITEQIRIRAGSVVLPLHNPVRVAEEWSVVDNLSGGRVGISFAPGWYTDDFTVFAPQSYDARKDVMMREIETVRKLWRGEPISFRRNGAGSEVDIKILPRAVQPELPIWITAAGNPETYRMAGEVGFNVLTHLLGQSLEEVAGKIELYRQTREKHGHGPGQVTMMVHTYVGEDFDEVRETVREPFCNYLKTGVDVLSKLAQSRGLDLHSEEFTDDDMNALLAHAFDRYFETSGLMGTPESCLQMAEKIRDIGVDEIACLIDFGVDFHSVMSSLELVSKVKELCNAVKTA